MTDRTVKAILKGDISDFNRAMLAGAASAKAFAGELDTSTDRTANLTQGLLAVAPAVVPIGAAAIPAIAGLTTELAFAAAGAGVAALAFQGVGDALKATNDYAIDPSAANFDKMRQSMAELGPAGREFVNFLQEIRPELQGLQDAAQAGLFPGAEAGIADLMTRLPQVEQLISTIATAGGDMLAEAGANLASPKWNDFFDFLQNEARPTLIDFGRSLGNLVEGFANLWMAFQPLSDDFSESFLQMSRDFSKWTDGLGQTAGFKEFVDYIEQTGPKAWETLGAIGNALLQIVEAAAPVGAAVLPIITAIANTLATVADSNIGPILIGAAAGISAISRAVALYNVANGSAIGSLLTGTKGGKSPFRDAAAATTELKVAQDRLTQSAIAARDAQFALIPTSAKRRAIAEYATQSRAAADAERRAADATRSRAAQIGRLGVTAAGVAVVTSGLDEKIGLTNTATLGLAGAMVGPWGAALGATVGLVMDLNSRTDTAAKSVAEFNNQFAQSKSLDDQAAVIGRLKDQIDGLQNIGADWVTGDSVKTLQEGLGSLEEQYNKNKTAAQDLRFEESGMGDSMQGTTQVVRDQVDALLSLISARNKATEQELLARDASRAYEAAIDDAAASVKENGRTLDEGTPKGRANAAALDQIASAWNNLDAAGREAKGGLSAAREEFINAATSAGATKKQAEELASQLLKITPPKPIKIVAEDHASSVIMSIQEARDRLNDKTFTITTRRLELVTKGSLSDHGNAARAPKADGGLLVGPGGPRDDLIPISASNGEYVVNAAATRANLSLLHAINSGARIQRFADGGQVGASGPSAVTATIDDRRLARSVGREVASAFEGARFYMANDGSIRAKTQGA